MSNELLQKLESKIQNAVETIELLKMQIEELEEKNVKIMNENASLRNKQASWEKNLNVMLDKLSSVSSLEQQTKNAKVYVEPCQEEATV